MFLKRMGDGKGSTTMGATAGSGGQPEYLPDGRHSQKVGGQNGTETRHGFRQNLLAMQHITTETGFTQETDGTGRLLLRQ